MRRRAGGPGAGVRRSTRARRVVRGSVVGRRVVRGAVLGRAGAGVRGPVVGGAVVRRAVSVGSTVGRASRARAVLLRRRHVPPGRGPLGQPQRSTLCAAASLRCREPG